MKNRRGNSPLIIFCLIFGKLTFAIKKSSGVTKHIYFVCCVMYVMMAICLLIRFNLKKLNKPSQREVSILQLGSFWE